jgi:hypothetical protein
MSSLPPLPLPLSLLPLPPLLSPLPPLPPLLSPLPLPLPPLPVAIAVTKAAIIAATVTAAIVASIAVAVVERGREDDGGGQRTHFQLNYFIKCWASVCVVVEEKALNAILLNSDKTV